MRLLNGPGRRAPVRLVTPILPTLRRALSILLLPVGLVCFAFPLAQLFLQEDSGLIDDTRAYFGAGTDEGVPEVSQVSCIKRSYGSSSSRGVGMSDWGCNLYLVVPGEQHQQDPWAGRTYEEGFEEYQRRLSRELESLRSGNHISGQMERVLPFDRTGDLPTLRRLSAEGETPRFGVVWSGSEIAGRWFFWALIAALFFGIGCACLYAVRFAWRRNG